MALPTLTSAALTAALVPSFGDVLDERIAILLSDGSLMPVRNIVQDPEHHWAVGRGAWSSIGRHAASRGLRVAGHVHTHVADDPEPSALDYRSARSGWQCAVWHLRTGTLTWYTTRGVVGRQVVRPHGILLRALVAALCY